MYINISKVDFGRCYSGSGGGGEVVDLDYMTLSALGDGEITITIPAGIKSTYATSLSYSKDKSTWTDTIVDNTAKTISIPVTNGENVYLKGDASTWFDEESYEGLSINSTANINASGNVMSLLYGDNFKDKTTLPVGYNFNLSGLFSGNEHLINAEHLILSATELNSNCYYSMFDSCTSLTTAPQLPATTLAESCYENMFSACSSLTTAPELNATTLDAHCYFSMFSDCTSLTTAPALPATTLAMSCYAYMFSGCTSLTTAPQLPVTALVNNCYNSMFAGCTSLTTAQQLPATALVNGCYNSMFFGCTSLTAAPELPAATLAESCYERMFSGCSSLNSIIMLATDISAASCLNQWVNGVASTGTFTKSPEMTSLPTGVNGVPEGWTVKDYTDYMTLSALGDGEITITIPAAINSSYASYLSYSKDKLSWSVTIVDDTDQTITIPVTNGENVYLRGEAKQLGKYNSFININSTADINASGNIMSLLYGDDYKDKVAFQSGSEWTFNSLFSGNAHLINAKDLILPATTLASTCYYYMFNGCTSLTTAPELPATTLTNSCYRFMFQGCTSLTTAHKLPATTLTEFCYASMFNGCTSLTTAPELPATTLTNSCYMFMFEGCTSLATAPELPATTLTDSCYEQMFYGCSNLNSITMLATDISAQLCLHLWVSGVAPTGTFIKSPEMTSLPTGDSGIPSGWTVKDYGVVDYSQEYMTLSALGDGEITITIPAEINSSYATSFSYSKDKSTWTDTIVDNTAQTITIPVTSGENVYLKGIAKQLGNSSNCVNINSTANINASGNTMSLLYGDDYNGKTSFPEGSKYAFKNLFRGNTHLINAENLVLPATSLTYYCYSSMFKNCTSLTTAHELPATTLAPYCYQNMFSDCYSLTTAPNIHATTLVDSCYSSMFSWCTSLTTAPELPATTLTEYCYSSMFSGCKKLNNITMLATDISAASCLENWVSGVAPTGTFTKAAEMTSLPTGKSGIPEGWSVVDYGVA